MSLARRFLVGFGAVAITTTMVAAAGVQGAWAKKAGPVNASGTVSCTGAAGLLKLSPGLTLTGASSPDTVSVKVNLNGCDASGTTNVTTSNFTGHASGTLQAPSQNCSALSGTSSVSGSLSISWTGKAGTAKLNNSKVTITSLTGITTGANGNPGFTISSQSVSGSFSGTISGELDSAQNVSALANACGKSSGLTKVTINAGTLGQP